MRLIKAILVFTLLIVQVIPAPISVQPPPTPPPTRRSIAPRGAEDNGITGWRNLIAVSLLLGVATAIGRIFTQEQINRKWGPKDSWGIPSTWSPDPSCECKEESDDDEALYMMGDPKDGHIKFPNSTSTPTLRRRMDEELILGYNKFFFTALLAGIAAGIGRITVQEWMNRKWGPERSWTNAWPMPANTTMGCLCEAKAQGISDSEIRKVLTKATLTSFIW